ncbi:hypothetical protein [Joostella sp. CR20]|uniref:hypothetical protein n=1 Tax=Joostella sp. CR20 TaxID=2804312 RepID=UPI00313B99DC
MRKSDNTLDNKVDLLPIFSNIIGIDKLIVEIPRESCKAIDIVECPMLVGYSVTVEFLYAGKVCEGVSIREYPENIRLTINPAIFLYGNNFVTIGLPHIKVIVDKLEEEYKLDIKGAIIRRLDLQCTLKTSLTPIAYYSILGGFKSFNRNIVSSTLYYNSKAAKKYKTGLFYDKMKQASPEVPKEYFYGEYMRIEWQYFNRFLKAQAQKLNLGRIRVRHLLISSIYQSMIDIWYSDFKAIYKEPVKIVDMSLINKISDMDNMLINQGVENIGGLMVLENMINDSRHFKDKPRDFYSKMKKRYRDKSKLSKFTYASPLIDELNEKVGLAYQNTINSL